MKCRPACIAFFLLTNIFSVAQENYDTLWTYQYYAKDQSSYAGKYQLVTKHIRFYDNKGRVSYVQGFEYGENNSNPYFFYQETHKYGPNDSLLTIQIDEVPRGMTKFWIRELWEYFYKGNQLTEVRTTRYAHTGYEKYANQRLAREWNSMGGSITDTSGWTTVSSTRYTYDEQGRLTRKGKYRDQKDTAPEMLWLYTYGNELPDINTYIIPQSGFIVRRVYNHLYKNGKLVVYRNEDHAGCCNVEQYRYSYNKEGLPEELEISTVKYRHKKVGDPYKQDGKPNVTYRYEYKYRNGKLTSEVVHYKSSYKKYKVSFLDRLGNMPSVSTSTTRYGDYQTTTTTVKSNYNPPPRKEDMIEKTKYKWNKYTLEYEYDANGKRVIKGGTLDDSNHNYDSKGRLIFRQICEYKDQYDERPTCVQYRYGYRK